MCVHADEKKPDSKRQVVALAENVQNYWHSEILSGEERFCLRLPTNQPSNQPAMPLSQTKMYDEKVLHAQWTVNWNRMRLYFMAWVWLCREEGRWKRFDIRKKEKCFKTKLSDWKRQMNWICYGWHTLPMAARYISTSKCIRNQCCDGVVLGIWISCEYDSFMQICDGQTTPRLD